MWNYHSDCELLTNLHGDVRKEGFDRSVDQGAVHQYHIPSLLDIV